ncbi:MAG: multicopper oxidase family protein [Rhodanobacteraceae bacterium]
MAEPLAVTRRDFLRCLGLGSAAALVWLPVWRAWARTDVGFSPDLWLKVVAAPAAVAIRPGAKTPVWSYRASVLKGDAASVSPMPGGYPGPILHVRRGQKLRVDFVNRIDEPSIINWHGLHVPATMMGLPRYAAKPGGTYRYEFTVDNRAGTYWYHAMSAGHTPEQVYYGLAGLLLVHGPEADAVPLPRGEYDLPIVIQDRDFGGDNRFTYPLGAGPDAARGVVVANPPSMSPGGMMGGGMMDGGMDRMMTRVMGFFGDSVLVNGHPDAAFDVATRAYRLRVLNASNSRIYKLAWNDGRPLTVIATGGGLLQMPASRDYVMLAPGQRVELWADFSADAVGAERTMLSLPFAGTMGMLGGSMGMMGRMMGNASLPPGARFPLFKVRVARKSKRRVELPRQLSTLTRLRAEDAVNRTHPRTFRITMTRMRWGFNGRSFQMGEVARDEIVKLGTTEVWEFANNMMMAHAIHLHGLQFQVLERLDSPKHDGVLAGCVDDGWEDTVLVMPGERVRIIMRFTDFTGTYAYQCHMLEHAADGLMRNYRVQA